MSKLLKAGDNAIKGMKGALSKAGDYAMQGMKDTFNKAGEYAVKGMQDMYDAGEYAFKGMKAGFDKMNGAIKGGFEELGSKFNKLTKGGGKGGDDQDYYYGTWVPDATPGIIFFFLFLLTNTNYTLKNFSVFTNTFFFFFSLCPCSSAELRPSQGLLRPSPCQLRTTPY